MADEEKAPENKKEKEKDKEKDKVAGEESQEEGEKASRKGLFGNKYVVIGIIIAIQIVVVVLIGEKLVKPTLLAQEPEEVAIEVKDPQERGQIHLLEDIIINLNGGEKTRFLKMSIGFEVDSELVIAEMTERSAQIRDIVITSVSGRRVEELVSVEGKELLKSELQDKIASNLQSGKLMRVYFSNFVVQ